MYQKNKKPLSPEEKFELMMQKFKKTSSEILQDAGHKKHTKRIEVHEKFIKNERRKMKNRRKDKSTYEHSRNCPKGTTERYI